MYVSPMVSFLSLKTRNTKYKRKFAIIVGIVKSAAAILSVARCRRIVTLRAVEHEAHPRRRFLHPMYVISSSAVSGLYLCY